MPIWCFAGRGAFHARYDHAIRHPSCARPERRRRVRTLRPVRWPVGIPVYPPYPYRSGHYPKVDSYYDLPPYAAIDPRFYRQRYFLMAQERNRYRYMPHIFHGYSDGDGDGSDLK